MTQCPEFLCDAFHRLVRNEIHRLAVGGVFEMAPHLPKLSVGWADGMVSALTATRVEEAVRGASDGAQLAIVAVLAGITFLITAVTLQNR